MASDYSTRTNVDKADESPASFGARANKTISPHIQVPDDSLVVLVELLENIDSTPTRQRLNEHSISDNNGGRILM